MGDFSLDTTILLESSSPFLRRSSFPSESWSDLCLVLLVFLGLVDADPGDASSFSEVDRRARLDLLGEPRSGDGDFSFAGSGEGDFFALLASGGASSGIDSEDFVLSAKVNFDLTQHDDDNSLRMLTNFITIIII